MADDEQKEKGESEKPWLLFKPEPEAVPRKRKCTSTRTDDESSSDDEHFGSRIERATVEDISLQVFYRPHTLGMLFVLVACGLYLSFHLDDSNREDNIWMGIKVIFFVFLIISALAFPNGPFTRPHPVLWQMVFGISCMYLLFLQFFLFQNFKDVKLALKWFDPQNLNKEHLDEKEYATECDVVTWEKIYDHMDVFAVGHFLGWGMKAMLIRHTFIAWYMSIAWELTEVAFAHLLPNFKECWWDQIILDILLCNGLGILVGTWIGKKLEMRQFRWESIKKIRGTKGKIKRAVMQFTPASWTHVRWMDPNSGVYRVLGIWEFVVVWQINELNTFFIKHIFAIDTSHPLVICRILLIGLCAAPSIRQWYNYVTDPKCTRIGTQCWIYCAITFTEATMCLKFGQELFAQTAVWYIFVWVVVLFFGSIFAVYISVISANYSAETKEVKYKGEKIHRWMDSSMENLNVHLNPNCPNTQEGSLEFLRKRHPQDSTSE